jgi:ubiquinone/menaquinone biosynthesis C-methylase UbiE
MTAVSVPIEKICMQNQRNIIDCYNRTAKKYADKFIDELSHKHLDRILLRSFALENIHRGKIIDLGCGPGQTTRFLSECGITPLVGTDLSPAMIDAAKQCNPQLHFETADMLALNYSDNTFGSAVAFYSIVHFSPLQVKTAFMEIKRVLIKGGQFLFSFHVGKEPVHLDEFLDQQVNIDFCFFEVSQILNLLKEADLKLIDVIEREPYPDVEHPSKRAYVWVKT